MTKTTLHTYTVAAFVLATVAGTLAFASLAHADRVSARFDAGLVRQQAAPAEGDAGSTGGTNGGESGESGSEGNTEENNSLPDTEAATQELMDDFIANASDEVGTSGEIGEEVDDLPGDIDGENIGGSFTGGSSLSVLNSVLTRFNF